MNTKIVTISGVGPIGARGFLAMAEKLAATDIVTKPFEPSELLSCVARCPADIGRNRSKCH